MAAIRLEDIEKNFPGVRALNDVNLDINSGEFFTLLGPSGCGKTTLLRIIAGFYQQDRGSVFLDGRQIDRVPAYNRNTGMVFQNYAVFPHMTVFENVAFGLRNRKVPRDEIDRRVSKVLALARLSGYEKRTPDQLSGGQQQRVGLARAMVIEPQVLLMDEPLSNLDAKLRLEMREEIRDIQRQLGTTTLYVTHDQEEALVISDRIAVMNGGVVEQIGTPWEVYKHPESVFVASFVGHMNLIEGVITPSIAGMSVRVGDEDVQIASIPDVRNKPNGASGVSGQVLLAARPEDIEISDHNAGSGNGQLRLVCTVKKSTFTGSLIQYALATDAGFTLLAERHRPEPDRTIPVGKRVMVAIASRSMHLFDKVTRRRIELGGSQ